MLYDVITNYCQRRCADENPGEVCADCNHPSNKCSGSCDTCLDEVHYGGCEKRKDYECGRLLPHYTLRFSGRYMQNIEFALSKIDLSQYDRFNILSIGCGPAPDLMAFEKIANGKKIGYKGIDRNKLWKKIHKRIEEYSEMVGNVRAKLYREDAFDILKEDFIG